MLYLLTEASQTHDLVNTVVKVVDRKGADSAVRQFLADNSDYPVESEEDGSPLPLPDGLDLDKKVELSHWSSESQDADYLCLQRLEGVGGLCVKAGDTLVNVDLYELGGDGDEVDVTVNGRLVASLPSPGEDDE